MKKIKSKLVYINPQHKLVDRRESSLSPDYKNQSRIPTTQSPVKQIQQYYSVKQKSSLYFTNNNKTRKNENTFDSININKFNNQFDLQKLSENIKIRSSHQSENSSKKYYQPIDPYYSECMLQQDSKKNSSSSLNLENTARIQRNQVYIPNYEKKQSKSNFQQLKSSFMPMNQLQNKCFIKQIQKKNDIYSTPTNKYQRIKFQNQNLKPFEKKGQFSQIFDQQRQIFKTQNKNSNENLPIQKQFSTFELVSLKQENRFLKEKLIQKQEEIDKFQNYCRQYEQLGSKNLKLEAQMKKVLNQITQIKQQSKQKHQNAKSLIISQKQNQIYRNFSDDDQFYESFQEQLTKHSNDNYIKIYDQFNNQYDNQKLSEEYDSINSSSQVSSINDFKTNPDHKKKIKIGVKSNKNQIISSNQQKHQNWNFSKRNCQTEQTQGQQLDSKFIHNQQDTIKKRPKFIVKKTDPNINITGLIQSNKSLALSIERLTIMNQKAIQQMIKSNDQILHVSQRMEKWEEQLASIRVNLSRICQGINPYRSNDPQALKSELKSVEGNITKLFKTIDQHSKQLKKDHSYKTNWLKEQTERNHDIIQQNQETMKTVSNVLSQRSNVENEIQMNSPTFSHLSDERSLNEQSFKLSKSDRQDNQFPRKGSDPHVTFKLHHQQFDKIQEKRRNGHLNQSFSNVSKGNSENSQIKIEIDDLYEEFDHDKYAELISNDGKTNGNVQNSAPILSRFVSFSDKDKFPNSQTLQNQLFSHKSEQKCITCGRLYKQNQSNTQIISRLNMEANQMRALILDLTSQRDNLKKMIKSKIQAIDSLQSFHSTHVKDPSFQGKMDIQKLRIIEDQIRRQLDKQCQGDGRTILMRLIYLIRQLVDNGK